MSDAALSLSFFVPKHGLHGCARVGATLLFESERSNVVPVGPRVEHRGEGWLADLDGAFSL